MADLYRSLSNRLRRSKTTVTRDKPPEKSQEKHYLKRAKAVRRIERFDSLRQALSGSRSKDQEEKIPTSPSIASIKSQKTVMNFESKIDEERRRSGASLETVINFKPIVKEVSTVNRSGVPNPNQYKNKPLPPLPAPLPDRPYVSPVAQFGSYDYDWEETVDMAYELGEFIDPDMISRGHQTDQVAPLLEPPVSQRLIARGRPVPQRPFREEYLASRPRPSRK
ncbi:hypothetical protein EG329_013928 [Mollisiaceae sp. DMI_Dod_QoI]|nr:hypothetical protein EG329_013928 [Helotiales sp. DMI_Dod_QoI]